MIGAQPAEIFPRDVRELRLSRDVAQRVMTGDRRLQVLVACDEAALVERDAGAVGGAVRDVRAAPDRDEQAVARAASCRRRA